MRFAAVAPLGMFAVLGIALALPRVFPSMVVLFPFLVVLGLGIGFSNIVLPILVRCRVCGVRVNEEEPARSLSHGDRLAFLYELQRCPRCGDEGSALPAARDAWKREPRGPYPTYWNGRRISLAILAVFIMLVAVELVGRFARAGP